MNLKEFFRPNLLKIVMFVVLFIFFTFLPTGFIKNIIGSFKVFPQIHGLGLPFLFYKEGVCGVPAVIGQYIKTYCPPTFRLIKLIIDLLFWYVIASGLLFLFKNKNYNN